MEKELEKNIDVEVIQITSEIANLKDYLIEKRRDFHKHPESGWVEYRTASIVADELIRLGFQVFSGKEACRSDSRMGVPGKAFLDHNEKRALEEGANPYWIDKLKDGHTAVVGVLKTGKPGPVVALRFDIDSLDMEESSNPTHRPNKEGFATCHPGMMHACGHDGHTAIGLGVAELLAKHRDQLNGEIRLLFQPAEEGCRGAKSMVDAGWLDGVDYFFSGHISFKSKTLGEIVAAVDGFLATTKLDVTYTGRAAHAGEAPQDGKNALLAAASAALHLSGINRHSGGATRINIGTLNAGTGRNVVADRAVMKLETRGETTELNEYMLQEALRVIENTAKVYDVTCEWSIQGKGIGAKSSGDLIPFIQQETRKMDKVTSFVSSRELGGSEDVVYMLNRVQEQGGKAVYMLFGSPLTDGHHQACFDFDEEVLLIGTEVLTRLVLSCPGWGKA